MAIALVPVLTEKPQQQLVSQGFMVDRQPVDNMSPKERERYKKALKKEAAEERILKKSAWQAVHGAGNA